MSTAQAYLTPKELSFNNADHLWHLEQAGLVEGLAGPDLEAINKAFQDRIYPENEVLYRPGQKADHLFLVNRGTIRLMAGTPSGGEKILALYSAGDLFGEEVINRSRTYKAHAVAHEESWVSVLAANKLDELAKRVPRIALNLARILNAKVASNWREIEALSFESTENRVARTLALLSSRHGRPVASHPGFKKLTLSLTHEHISQLVGANRPHVSSILSKFKQKGTIKYRNRKILIHEEKVQSLLQELRS